MGWAEVTPAISRPGGQVPCAQAAAACTARAIVALPARRPSPLQDGAARPPWPWPEGEIIEVLGCGAYWLAGKGLAQVCADSPNLACASYENNLVAGSVAASSQALI